MAGFQGITERILRQTELGRRASEPGRAELRNLGSNFVKGITPFLQRSAIGDKNVDATRLDLAVQSGGKFKEIADELNTLKSLRESDPTAFSLKDPTTGKSRADRFREVNRTFNDFVPGKRALNRNIERLARGAQIKAKGSEKIKKLEKELDKADLKEREFAEKKSKNIKDDAFRFIVGEREAILKTEPSDIDKKLVTIHTETFRGATTSMLGLIKKDLVVSVFPNLKSKLKVVMRKLDEDYLRKPTIKLRNDFVAPLLEIAKGENKNDNFMQGQKVMRVLSKTKGIALRETASQVIVNQITDDITKDMGLDPRLFINGTNDLGTIRDNISDLVRASLNKALGGGKNFNKKAEQLGSIAFKEGTDYLEKNFLKGGFLDPGGLQGLGAKAKNIDEQWSNTLVFGKWSPFRPANQDAANLAIKKKRGINWQWLVSWGLSKGVIVPFNPKTQTEKDYNDDVAATLPNFFNHDKVFDNIQQRALPKPVTKAPAVLTQGR